MIFFFPNILFFMKHIEGLMLFLFVLFFNIHLVVFFFF